METPRNSIVSPGLRIGGVVAAIFCGLALAPASLAAQRRPIEPRQPWSERWLANVPVSGGLRVGVMAVGEQGRRDADRFYVLLPPGNPRTACVEVSSRDGRFEARFEYPVSGEPPGLVPLAFRAQHASEIRGLKPDELAILAHVGDRCDEGVKTFVIAAWERNPAPEVVTVFLNSRVPTYIIGVEGRRVKHESQCEELSGTITAFNLRCDVPFSWITPSVTFKVRKRERVGTGTSIVDTPLPLSK